MDPIESQLCRDCRRQLCPKCRPRQWRETVWRDSGRNASNWSEWPYDRWHPNGWSKWQDDGWDDSNWSKWPDDCWDDRSWSDDDMDAIESQLCRDCQRQLCAKCRPRQWRESEWRDYGSNASNWSEWPYDRWHASSWSVDTSEHVNNCRQHETPEALKIAQPELSGDTSDSSTDSDMPTLIPVPRPKAGPPVLQQYQTNDGLPEHQRDAVISIDPPILLSQDDMLRTDACEGWAHGGKAAYQTQQGLRKLCLENDIWEIDLNQDRYWVQSQGKYFSWKNTILAMPPATRADIIGGGITGFVFKLLHNVKDTNYPTEKSIASDTGERHVFECACVDGTLWHLHYHKNGTLDAPYRIPPLSSIWHLSTRRCQVPIVFSLEDIFDSTPETQIPLGTGELVIALTNICSDQDVYDITDMQAVHWHRWLRALEPTTAAEYIGPGIERVYAYNRSQGPTLVLARSDNIAKSVYYSQSSKKKWRPHDYTSTNWRTDSLFSMTVIATTSWLRIKATI